MKSKKMLIAALASALMVCGGAIAGDCGSKDLASGCSSGKKDVAGCSAEGAKVAQGGADEAKGSCASTCSSEKVAQGGAEGKSGCGDGGKCEGKCSASAQGGAEDAGKDGASGFELGKAIPAHELKNVVTGNAEPLFDGKAKATVLVFWNQKCPYVVEVDERFQAFAKEMAPQGVRVVAIDSNFNNTDAEILEHASARPFTMLRDADSMTALAFNAGRTPEVFVLDGNGVISYHGAFDGGQNAPEKTYAADAVKAVLAGNAPEVTKTRAFGCTIKWADSAKEAMKAKESKQAKGTDKKDAEAKQTAAK